MKRRHLLLTGIALLVLLLPALPVQAGNIAPRSWASIEQSTPGGHLPRNVFHSRGNGLAVQNDRMDVSLAPWGLTFTP